MEHKTIESKYGTVHYWICKNNKEHSKVLIFTHGLTANHMMFEKQVEFFSKDHTVITWDIPLHGESRGYSNFTYENTANELKSILDHENIDKVILIGMSMGGYPSQEFAFRYENMVEGFIAIDTTPFGLDYYSKLDKLWLKLVEPMTKLYTDKFLRNSIAKGVSKTTYSHDLMLKMLEPLSKSDIGEQMGIAYSGFLKENKNVSFKFPVIILLGEHDKVGRVKAYCETWSKKEGYPIHIIKGASHFSNGDNPDEVNDIISKFIEGLA